MDSRAGLQRRAAGGSPAPGSGQSRRARKQPPRPADFKLQAIIIGSRGVGKTSLMERFTDDTFCEACKSTVGPDPCSALSMAVSSSFHALVALPSLVGLLAPRCLCECAL